MNTIKVFLLIFGVFVSLMESGRAQHIRIFENGIGFRFSQQFERDYVNPGSDYGLVVKLSAKKNTSDSYLYLSLTTAQESVLTLQELVNTRKKDLKESFGAYFEQKSTSQNESKSDYHHVVFTHKENESQIGSYYVFDAELSKSVRIDYKKSKDKEFEFRLVKEIMNSVFFKKEEQVAANPFTSFTFVQDSIPGVGVRFVRPDDTWKNEVRTGKTFTWLHHVFTSSAKPGGFNFSISMYAAEFPEAIDVNFILKELVLADAEKYDFEAEQVNLIFSAITSVYNNCATASLSFNNSRQQVMEYKSTLIFDPYRRKVVFVSSCGIKDDIAKIKKYTYEYIVQEVKFPPIIVELGGHSLKVPNGFAVSKNSPDEIELIRPSSQPNEESKQRISIKFGKGTIHEIDKDEFWQRFVLTLKEMKFNDESKDIALKTSELPKERNLKTFRGSLAEPRVKMDSFLLSGSDTSYVLVMYLARDSFFNKNLIQTLVSNLD
ncbi:hypothetical protein EP331_12135 [bacterium]|nr:MAG: hypothetical protein EP331_12135 [bacterium]